MLNPYEIGLMRIGEMCVSSSRFSREDIMRIGQCSIERNYIIVGRIGNDWVVMNYARNKVRDFKGHGYIVKGKKVIALQRSKQGSLQELMDAYECADHFKPLVKMTAEEIFNSAKGVRTRKHGQRGGMSFAEMRKGMNWEPVETSRPWKRGERVKMRNENKRNQERAQREASVMGIIKCFKTGLVYKSTAKATKYNCGRVIV